MLTGAAALFTAPLPKKNTRNKALKFNTREQYDNLTELFIQTSVAGVTFNCFKNFALRSFPVNKENIYSKL